MQNEIKNNDGAINLGLILSAIVEAGNTAAGAAINRDSAFITRLKANEKTLTLEEFCHLLAAIKLDVIHRAQEQITIERPMFDSLTTLAKLGLTTMQANTGAK